MGQWTDVDPNTLLPGDPWTSAKAQAAFENLEAVAEGAPGAPRLYGKAAVPVSQRSELAPLTGLTAANEPLLDELHYSGAFTSGSTSGTTYVSLGIITSVLMSGTVRFRASHRTFGSSYSSTLRILKNGVEVQVWTASLGDGLVARSVDIAVVPGDTIEWQHRSSTTGSVQASNFLVSASDVYVRIGIPIKASDL